LNWTGRLQTAVRQWVSLAAYSKVRFEKYQKCAFAGWHTPLETTPALPSLFQNRGTAPRQGSGEGGAPLARAVVSAIVNQTVLQPVSAIVIEVIASFDAKTRTATDRAIRTRENKQTA
jgi:hypothetical protein